MDKPLNDLCLEKIKNMLAAHDDGVYALEARGNLYDIISYLVMELEINDAAINLSRTVLASIKYDAGLINEAAGREMDMGDNHAGVQIAYIKSGKILKDAQKAKEIL